MSKKQELPPSRVYETALTDVPFRVVQGGAYEVLSWRPGPPRSGPSTEVHVLIPVPVVEGMKVVLRLKSPRALDELVGVLLEYRKRVWP